ncbi:hypothetical protein D8674_025568 [Pyrus ussuriensis x Pyrus communis]|uniref:Retrotransposon gag domain-containing protein n=1 Tax=Pyrus ussuriensis x Pyrus communis TaxID=2448454 RepID=A0A5N5IIH5_9ROSA|nr:hypothetical protein D8674_025568 [Pyrus ussuriensis x Pyrus communis]
MLILVGMMAGLMQVDGFNNSSQVGVVLGFTVVQVDGKMICSSSSFLARIRGNLWIGIKTQATVLTNNALTFEPITYSWENIEESFQLSADDAINGKVFKHLFQKRFIPLEYLDHKRDEFSELKQGKMSATEYHRKFTDLSRYSLEIVANPVEMLRRFKKGTSKKLCSMATLTPCSTYQEFFKVLLRVEDSENALDDSDEEEEKGVASSQVVPDSRGKENPNSYGAPLCRRCNNRHFEECRQGGSGRCFTCGLMGHKANQSIPLKQILGPSGYTLTGYGVIHSIREAIRRIRHIRAVDHSGIMEDSPRTLMLPLVVLVCRGSLINLVRDEVIKEIETCHDLSHERETIVEERMSGLSSSCGAK